MFLIFESDDSNLKPKAEGCDQGEQRMDIGNVMHVRHTSGRPELVVVRDKEMDDPDIVTVKEIIRQATAVKPEGRPTAAWIVEWLKPLAKVPSSTYQNCF